MKKFVPLTIIGCQFLATKLLKFLITLQNDCCKELMTFSDGQNVSKKLVTNA